METLKCWHSLYGYIVVFMFFTAVSAGSTCEAPSSPQCFKRKADDDIYFCEWDMNTTDSNVTYDLHVSKKKIERIKKTWFQMTSEWLVKYRKIDIWVEAHVGSSSCTSTRTSVILNNTVKYEAPQNISMSWLKKNLKLSWIAAEDYPALTEIRFRRAEHPSESWEYRVTNATSQDHKYQVIIKNLLTNTAYDVQIRHLSNQASNPLWSDWSAVIVPAELGQKPQVSMTTRLVDGTRNVTLKWKSMPHAAAAAGLKYRIMVIPSSPGCPCGHKKMQHHTESTEFTTYVSYSAVNISVIAINAAGHSPPTILQLQHVPADLKICDKTLLDKNLKRQMCLEFYQLQDGELWPANVITLKAKNNMNQTIKDYIRYLYFEHRCEHGKPQTAKMCHFYNKEGVPDSEPRNFTLFDETQSSVNLSWKMIALENQRGFITHYRLCSMKINSLDEPTVCHNISELAEEHHLENLSPGSKYKVSLAGATRVGEGPQATLTFNTLPENSVSVLPWSLSLLSVLCLISIIYTCIATRIKNKIYPPVPTPTISNFPLTQLGSQKMLERKEEVDELTLLQLHPENKSTLEDTKETTDVGDQDDDTGNAVKGRVDLRMLGGTSDEGLSPDSTDQALRSSREAEVTDDMDNELAMLIYRNGLVFDAKTDSP